MRRRNPIACVLLAVVLLALVPVPTAAVDSPGAFARTDTLRLGTAAEAGFDPDRLQLTVEWVEELVASGEVPGAQLLIARDGVIAAMHSFGVIDAEAGRPMDEESLLWLASITKPFTATAVMQLADRGLLGLDDPVSRYLPQYEGQRLQSSAGGGTRSVTIRQLLSHTSGLGGIPTRHSTMGEGWLDQTIAFAVDSIAVDSLRFEPGTDWNYANAGYVTLGRVVEVVSGRPFNHFVREGILDPLGLHNTVWVTEFSQPMAPRLAKVYRERDGRLEPYFAYDSTFSYRNGAPNGGLFGNVLDAAKFAQMFLNDGEYGGQRILAPATARLMLADQTEGLDQRWGLGWATQWPTARGDGARRGRCVFGHTGSAGTHLWVDRDQRLIGVIFLQWSDDQGSLNSYRDRFQHLVYASLPAEALSAGGAENLCD